MRRKFQGNLTGPSGVSEGAQQRGRRAVPTEGPAWRNSSCVAEASREAGPVTRGEVER